MNAEASLRRSSRAGLGKAPPRLDPSQTAKSSAKSRVTGNAKRAKKANKMEAAAERMMREVERLRAQAAALRAADAVAAPAAPLPPIPEEPANEDVDALMGKMGGLKM